MSVKKFYLRSVDWAEQSLTHFIVWLGAIVAITLTACAVISAVV